MSEIKNPVQRVYIVQQEFQGLPDSTLAFSTWEKAEERYLKVVNDFAKQRGDDSIEDYHEAENWMEANWGYNGVRIFVVDIR